MSSTFLRKFLRDLALAAPLGAAEPRQEPKLGMIFPPKDNPVPPEAKLLYPKGVEFLADTTKQTLRRSGLVAERQVEDARLKKI